MILEPLRSSWTTQTWGIEKSFSSQSSALIDEARASSWIIAFAISTPMWVMRWDFFHFYIESFAITQNSWEFFLLFKESTFFSVQINKLPRQPVQHKPMGWRQGWASEWLFLEVWRGAKHNWHRHLEWHFLPHGWEHGREAGDCGDGHARPLRQWDNADGKLQDFRIEHSNLVDSNSELVESDSGRPVAVLAGSFFTDLWTETGF